MMKHWKQMHKFFGKYPQANALVHALLGIGIGLLMAYPLAGSHPVRWAAVFLGVGIVGHIYAAFSR